MIALHSLDTHPSSDEQPDLGRRDVVVDQLFDYNDVATASYARQRMSDRAMREHADGSPMMVQDIV